MQGVVSVGNDAANTRLTLRELNNHGIVFTLSLVVSAVPGKAVDIYCVVWGGESQLRERGVVGQVT